MTLLSTSSRRPMFPLYRLSAENLQSYRILFSSLSGAILCHCWLPGKPSSGSVPSLKPQLSLCRSTARQRTGWYFCFFFFPDSQTVTCVRVPGYWGHQVSAQNRHFILALVVHTARVSMQTRLKQHGLPFTLCVCICALFPGKRRGEGGLYSPAPGILRSIDWRSAKEAEKRQPLPTGRPTGASLVKNGFAFFFYYTLCTADVDRECSNKKVRLLGGEKKSANRSY